MPSSIKNNYTLSVSPFEEKGLLDERYTNPSPISTDLLEKYDFNLCNLTTESWIHGK